MKVFVFNPATYSASYADHGYVHIPQGVDPSFLAYARDFTQAALDNDAYLNAWQFSGKKRQLLFELPQHLDWQSDIKTTVSALANLPLDRVTLCERHIKIYESDAPSHPPPHKDRLASEVTLGIPLDVPPDSYLALYPDVARDVNPFASTAEHRRSLNDDQLPEHVLAEHTPSRLYVSPGDVVIFQGASIYHERINPANARVLYLKFNARRLDPFAEDPSTVAQRSASQKRLAELDDNALLQARVMVSPRLEKLSRHYTRLDWAQVLQLRLCNEAEITVSEAEFELIKAVGEGCTVRDALNDSGLGHARMPSMVASLRRLVRTGALELS